MLSLLLNTQKFWILIHSTDVSSSSGDVLTVLVKCSEEGERKAVERKNLCVCASGYTIETERKERKEEGR